MIINHYFVHSQIHFCCLFVTNLLAIIYHVVICNFYSDLFYILSVSCHFYQFEGKFLSTQHLFPCLIYKLQKIDLLSIWDEQLVIFLSNTHKASSLHWVLNIVWSYLKNIALEVHFLIFCFPITFEQEHTHHCELDIHVPIKNDCFYLLLMMEAYNFSSVSATILCINIFWTKLFLDNFDDSYSHQSITRGWKSFDWVNGYLLVPCVNNISFAFRSISTKPL